MCILIKHAVDTVFDRSDLLDFYGHNKDGLGVMYIHNGKPVVEKILPKSGDEAYEFYLKHALGKECALHGRMKTHGDVDLSNCHPYEVIPGVYLMHNGILSTGNSWDKTKSDTWHFADRILKPILQQTPRMLHNPGFQLMLEETIGSGNRFILLDKSGFVEVNMDQGVTYKNAKMSNTYAWSAPNTFSTSRHGWDYGDWDTPVGKRYMPPTRYAPIKTYELDEDDEAIEYFFQNLEDANLWGAYNKLRYSDLENYVKAQGVEGIYALCGEVFELNLNDDEVVEIVRDCSVKREYKYDQMWGEL